MFILESGVSPTNPSLLREGSAQNLFIDDKEDGLNEEAFQASLKGRHYELFNIMDKNNPEKAREVFNSYFQLNKQIDVSIGGKNIIVTVFIEYWRIHQENRRRT